jgi:hypothetical protein
VSTLRNLQLTTCEKRKVLTLPYYMNEAAAISNRGCISPAIVVSEQA